MAQFYYFFRVQERFFVHLSPKFTKILFENFTINLKVVNTGIFRADFTSMNMFSKFKHRIKNTPLGNLLKT